VAGSASEKRGGFSFRIPAAQGLTAICFFAGLIYWCLSMAVRASTGTVFILAENLVLSAALRPLLRGSGYEIKEFQCLADFLDHTAPEAPCCLMIEFSLPGLNPANLQMILAERGIPIPFIFMMASPDTSGTVAAMKAGAFSVVAAE